MEIVALAQWAALAVLAAAGVLLVLIAKVVLWHWVGLSKTTFKRSCIYLGRVKHSRFKQAKHHLDYPLFFTFLDLQEVQEVGWALWPLFLPNAGWWALCSLEDKTHLTWKPDMRTSLYNRVRSYVQKEASVTAGPSLGGKMRVCLLTHLTYFGYCFNPVSFFYLLPAEEQEDVGADRSRSSISRSSSRSRSSRRSTNRSKSIKSRSPSSRARDPGLLGVVCEVSNTPWGEMHPYLLHEGVPGVDVARPQAPALAPAGEDGAPAVVFSARWLKAFHVSPFLGMGYRYSFSFSQPGDSLAVSALMHALPETGDKAGDRARDGPLAFSASFSLRRVPITPLSLLYVIITYPLYTRLIQVRQIPSPLPTTPSCTLASNHPLPPPTLRSCGSTLRPLSCGGRACPFSPIPTAPTWTLGVASRESASPLRACWSWRLCCGSCEGSGRCWGLSAS